eukprot:10520656-Karenia_brevis.AAC.1
MDNTTVLVNQSRIRKHPDLWHNVGIPGVLTKEGAPTLLSENEDGMPSATIGSDFEGLTPPPKTQ